MSIVRHLVVGDPHVTPEELEDCEALLGLVAETVDKEKVDLLTFTGDLHDTHDSLSTRVVEFWKRWFSHFIHECKVVALRGNHDQVTPSQAYPHALLAYSGIQVVGAPQELPLVEKVGAVPYYYDAEEFYDAARKLASYGNQTLFCHQTFSGAKYENGFAAKDGVDQEKIGFQRIVGGHLHTPQKVGRCAYVGAPRWRTLSDANKERHLWLFEHDGEKMKLAKRISTGDVCRRIFRFEDRPDAPAPVPESFNAKDTVAIDVYGPSAELVRAREAELKARFGARTRGFPDRVERVKGVREAEGIKTSFDNFMDHFLPPNGTPVGTLKPVLEERLGFHT